MGNRPEIDGILNDECWLEEGIWSEDYIQERPVQGGVPSEKTEFKILYDDENIYVAIRAYDSQPDKIDLRPAKRDDFSGDVVGVCFDSYNDQRTGFEFNLTAAGAKVDLLATNDGYDENWNAVWDGRTAMEDSAWTAEMRIPFSQLRYSNNTEQIWGLHAWRWISRNQEENQWQLIRRDTPARINEFGKLTGLNSLKKSRRIELLPYGVASVKTSEKIPEDPFAKGIDYRMTGGLDGKIGITSDFTMDFTINPDFGQVEADPSVLNLTAYETFFEEKRPFFLEGSNIMEYDLQGHNMLFYSRRIGSMPSYNPTLEDNEYAKIPDNTSIISAIKVTGKNPNGLSAGIMQSFTAREKAEIRADAIPNRFETVEPFTNYFVSRVQKDYNDANTIIGGIFTSTNRNLNENHLNSLTKNAFSGGLDVIHFWNNKTYYVRGKSIFSHVTGDPEAITRLQYSSARYMQRPDFSHLEIDSSRTSLTGSSGEFEIGKGGNGHLIYSFGLNYQSPELELNDVGYLRMADLVEQESSAGYQVFEPFSIFRSVEFMVSQSNYWNMGGYYLSSSVRSAIESQLTNRWFIDLGLSREFEGLQTRTLRGGPAFLTPGRWTPSLFIASDHGKKVVLHIGVDAYLSDLGITKKYAMESSVSMRIGNRLELMGSLDYNLEKEDLQYVDQFEYNDEHRYVMAFLDRKTMGFTLRADFGITPNLTIQYYGSPYFSTGEYSNFKRVTDSKADDYFDRFHTFSGNEIIFNPGTNEYLIDETVNSEVDYTISNPDFDFSEFRSNLVVRWEYKTGSTLYLVWTHSRSVYEDAPNLSMSDSISELWDVYPENVFLIKLNYWFSL